MIALPLFRHGVQVASAQVDDADGWVCRWRWFLNGNGYAMTNGWSVNRDLGDPEYRKRANVFLHRLLLHPPAMVEVDHVSRDRLDNRRANLRLTDRFGNGQNLTTRKGRRYRGVCWDTRHSTWRAYATVAKKQTHIGYFPTEEKAAAAAIAWRIQYMPYTNEEA